MTQRQKSLIKNIKVCISKPNTIQDYSLLDGEIKEKTSKMILQIIHKTLTSGKAKPEQKEAGKS